MQKEELLNKEKQLSLIRKEVLMYQQRNKDYVTGVKKNIDEVCIANVHIFCAVTVI